LKANILDELDLYRRRLWRPAMWANSGHRGDQPDVEGERGPVPASSARSMF
jgi:hypothetical protein